MPDDKEVERLIHDAHGKIARLFDGDISAGRNIREILSPAIRSAMRIGEKRAYEDAAKMVEGTCCDGQCAAPSELQAKADSLKGE